MQTHYEVLGLSRGASQEEIRAAYLRLLQVHHPDRSSDPDAGQITARLIEAYGVLSAPVARAVYDGQLRPSRPRTSSRRRVRRERFPWGRLVAGLAIVAGLAVGVYLLWAYVFPAGEDQASTAGAQQRMQGRGGRSSLNADAEQLRTLVRAHAIAGAHHREGDTEITIYELDRSRFSAEAFQPLVQKLEGELSNPVLNRDGLVSGMYFNARLMQLSIPIVNNRLLLRSVSREVQQVLTLGERPEIAQWLGRSNYAEPYQLLQQALRDAQASEQREQAAGSLFEMNALKDEAVRMDQQARAAEAAGDATRSRELSERHRQLVLGYDNWLDARDSGVRLAGRLDTLFNRCLDPAILMHRFDVIGVPAGSDDSPED